VVCGIVGGRPAAAPGGRPPGCVWSATGRARSPDR